MVSLSTKTKVGDRAARAAACSAEAPEKCGSRGEDIKEFSPERSSWASWGCPPRIPRHTPVSLASAILQQLRTQGVVQPPSLTATPRPLPLGHPAPPPLPALLCPSGRLLLCSTFCAGRLRDSATRALGFHTCVSGGRVGPHLRARHQGAETAAGRPRPQPAGSRHPRGPRRLLPAREGFSRSFSRRATA